MTPKILHYCWFGGKPLPEKERICIESWKKFLPDYEFKLWDESSFDINSNEFCRQAYELKKYAFVSDYVRTKVLYEYGGLYIDTDFEVITPLSSFLEGKNNVAGWETKVHVGTAILAFNAKHAIIKEFLNYYETHPFVDKNGVCDNIANVSILTDLLQERGLKIDRTHQIIDDVEIFEREVFYPKKLSESEFRVCENTLGIHKCSNSWMSDAQLKRGNNYLWRKIARPLLTKLRHYGQLTLGKEFTRKIEIKLRRYLK